MNKLKKIQTGFLYVVFTFYILFLLKLLLLSRFSFADLINNGMTMNRSINLIPFYSIKDYAFSNSENVRRFAFSNLVGNILIFVPLGAYLCLFKKKKSINSNFIFIFIVSLSVEIIQGILGIGSSDIDDIILNCLGGLIGILGYKLLLFIFKEEKHVRIIITIISALGLPVLLFLLFFVKLML